MNRPQRCCCALGCGVRIGPRMMFCRAHWADLTDRLRESIMESYRPGVAAQSRAYYRAAKRAGSYLSQVERWRAGQRSGGLMTADRALSG